MEYLDLYTAEHVNSGVRIARGEAVPAGLFPLVVGIWTVNSHGQVLMTLRDAAKSAWPNTWENSGGAVQAGEDSLHAAVRELREETGIEAAAEEFIFLQTDVTETEVLDCYLLHRDVSLEDIVLQEGETADARWLTPAEVEAMIAAGVVAEPIAQDWRRMSRLIMDELEKGRVNSMIMYGTHRCPDCEEAHRVLAAKGIAYEYRDIHAVLANLKELLALRDGREEFAPVKENGSIGVPCFYFPETGRIEFDVEKL